MTLACAAINLLMAAPAPCRVLVTRDEALSLAFGKDATIERRTVYLTEEQMAKARLLAGSDVPIESAMVVRYEGWQNDKLLGVGYIDTAVVRTLPASILYVVRSDDPRTPGKPVVTTIEILSWQEPPEYLPRPGWTDQLTGRPLDAELSVRRGIRAITGATLTSRSLTAGARRVLALHSVIPEPSPESAR